MLKKVVCFFFFNPKSIRFLVHFFVNFCNVSFTKLVNLVYFITDFFFCTLIFCFFFLSYQCILKHFSLSSHCVDKKKNSKRVFKKMFYKKICHKFIFFSTASFFLSQIETVVTVNFCHLYLDKIFSFCSKKLLF